jgi:Domain of unknown function (DUF4111)
VTRSKGSVADLCLDPTSAAYAREVTKRLGTALGEKLLGVYLHGSAVLGDFARERSDVDVVAVSDGLLTTGEDAAVAETLSSASLPCPARGLELHVVDRDPVEDLAESPPFELHVTTSPDRVVVGREHGGDPDLVMHYAVLREHGVALSGAPPAEIFPPVPRERLLRAFARELRWAAKHASPAYQVLNACRAWQCLEDDGLTSKLAGAVWARERVEDPAPIDVAIRNRRAESDAQPDPMAARAILETVVRRLEAG